MLAILETGSILERLTSFFTEVFGGDYPVDPLKLHQIAVRAAIVFLIGLAIVRRIIAEHGGSIEAGDNVPNGTIFTVELPV